MSLLTASWATDVAVFLITLAACLYFYFTRNFNHWKSKGVPHPKPVPFWGNFYECATMKKTIGDFLADLYKKIDAPFFGIFILDKPFLVIRNPELVKAILVKDFNHFQDRTVLSNKASDPFTAHMLFFSKNPEWKSIRSKLTPIFTSGKIKAMFPLINEAGEAMTAYVSKHAEESEWLEAKEICAKYATDVITSCAFGINAQSFESENAAFRDVGRKMFEFTVRNGFVQTSYFYLQALANKLKFQFFSEFCSNFLRNAFWKTIEMREKSNLKRNDLIDIIIQLRQQTDIFTAVASEEKDKVVAKAAEFFAAGFETTSRTIGFTLYEIALNKSIQDRLREEIVDKIQEHGGLTYEAIQSMTYLDQCVSETLRKYPVLPFLDRTCAEDYKIPDSDVVIEKGTPVYIPMFGLQYDPKYFPEPEVYDPERFSAENRGTRPQFCYLPFGEGPRICIGERFGLLGSKLGIICLVRNFELERCKKTPVPIVFEEKTFIVASKHGLFLKFRKLGHN